jgi:hypothetical protein
MFEVNDLIIAREDNGMIPAGSVGVVSKVDERGFKVVLTNDPHKIEFKRTLGDSVLFEKAPPVLAELF